jgi:hypothetical protein
MSASVEDLVQNPTTSDHVQWNIRPDAVRGNLSLSAGLFNVRLGKLVRRVRR